MDFSKVRQYTFGTLSALSLALSFLMPIIIGLKLGHALTGVAVTVLSLVLTFIHYHRFPRDYGALLMFVSGVMGANLLVIISGYALYTSWSSLGAAWILALGYALVRAFTLRLTLLYGAKIGGVFFWSFIITIFTGYTVNHVVIIMGHLSGWYGPEVMFCTLITDEIIRILIAKLGPKNGNFYEDQVSNTIADLSFSMIALWMLAIYVVFV